MHLIVRVLAAQAIFSLGGQAIGALSHVYWPNPGSWYAARIIEVDPMLQTVTVGYEDGRREVLEVSKEHKEFKIRVQDLIKE